MSAASIIPRPDAISLSWIQDRIRSAGFDGVVSGLQASPVGTGQLGDTFRLSLTYAAGSGPATIIGKFAAASADSRAIANAWQLYAREVGFYRDLAASARISTPDCFAAELDDQGNFVLLMADCSPARAGDQIAGLAPDLALAAMRQAARLHAAFWDCGENGDFAWLETGRMAQPFYNADILRNAWPVFRDRYGDVLTPDMVRVCGSLNDRYEAYMAPLARPRCVTHNDFRPDNMLFGPDGAVTVVDWQSAALGFNAVDVAYMIGGAFSPAARREAETALLETYHRELTLQGVTGYSRDDLDADYRHFSFAGINVAVGAAMMVGRTERGDRMFLTMLERHVAHVLDTGALAILDAGQA